MVEKWQKIYKTFISFRFMYTFTLSLFAPIVANSKKNCFF